MRTIENRRHHDGSRENATCACKRIGQLCANILKFDMPQAQIIYASFFLLFIFLCILCICFFFFFSTGILYFGYKYLYNVWEYTSFKNCKKVNQRIKFWKIYLNFQWEKIFAENLSIIKVRSISFCQLNFPDSFMYL